LAFCVDGSKPSTAARIPECIHGVATALDLQIYAPMNTPGAILAALAGLWAQRQPALICAA